MIKVSDTAKRKLSMQDDGFDAATDYVGRRESGALVCL
jgi:hypothetical protein